MITDAQVHLWDENRPERPWAPNATPHLPEPMTAERMLALMDEAGVDRAVISPLFLPYNGPEYALDVSERYPNRFKVMGWYNPARPGAYESLDTWLDHPGMCSARFSFNDPANAEAQLKGENETFWRKADEKGIPIGVFRIGGIQEYIEPVAAAHPNLKIIIDHLNMPMTPDVRDARTSELETLSKYPNIGVKVSALPRFSTEPAPFNDLQPYVKRVYQAYGADRLMWGSDQTQLIAANKATLKECLDMIKVHAADYIPPADMQLILNDTLATWMNWPAE
jgi:L-fuconolactonase